MKISKDNAAQSAKNYIEETKNILDCLNIDEIVSFIELLGDVYGKKKQLFIAGNGGSASTASHMASDLNKTTLGKSGDSIEKRFKAISLCNDIALMTAWANDDSFDQIYAQQLINFADPGDALLIITGSGNSPNLIKVVETAKQIGMTTFGFIGFDGGKIKPMLDGHIYVKDNSYGHVEDMHVILDHLVTVFFKDIIK